MLVRYVGPCADGVVIDILGVECAHGATVDVPDDVAASLLEQPDNWQAPKAAKSTEPKEG